MAAAAAAAAAIEACELALVTVEVEGELTAGAWAAAEVLVVGALLLTGSVAVIGEEVAGEADTRGSAGVAWVESIDWGGGAAEEDGERIVAGSSLATTGELVWEGCGCWNCCGEGKLTCWVLLTTMFISCDVVPVAGRTVAELVGLGCGGWGCI